MKRILLMAFGIAIILSIVVELLLFAWKDVNGPWWSHISVFFALFGFIGCIALVAIAKLIGHYWLQRKDDYYD